MTEKKQEDIPVGCIPPAFVVPGGGRVSLVLCPFQQGQWQIQDFPEVGEPTLRMGANIYMILPNFPPKTA